MTKLFSILILFTCFSVSAQVELHNAQLVNAQLAQTNSSGGGGGGLPAGVVFEWQLHGNLTDSSGNGHDASLTAGTATYTTGPDSVSGHALVFDGSTYITLSDTSVANVTSGDFTVSIWINIDTGHLGDFPIVIEKGVFNSYGYFWQLSSTGVPGNGTSSLITSQSGARQFVDGGYPITESTWHNIVIVRSGSVGTIYKDGVDSTGSVDPIIDPDTAISDGFRVGAGASGGSVYTGAASRVVFWNRALSPGEVATVNSLP